MNNKVLEELKQEYNETLNRAQDIGEIIANCADIDTHHCGQDADMDDACCQARGEQQEGFSYKDLLGREVIGIGGIASSCEHCGEADCVKVELVGGTYMCLAKPQQEEQDNERPVISFDEEEQQQEETTRTIMDGIREQTQAFMDYLDSVVKG